MSLRSRRTFLHLLGGTGAAVAFASRAGRAKPTTIADEFFVIVHAYGGWDVTLWADPRNELHGLVEPATTATIETGPLKRWVDGGTTAPGERSFALVQPRGSRLVFGPAIGDLADHYDRLTLFNGLAVNTVSHPDGVAFAATGRHLAGGRVPGTSVDAIVASELGAAQVLPAVSVRFPSSVNGPGLDPRATPLSVAGVDTIGKVLGRSNATLGIDERAAVTALLSEECRDLASRSVDPRVPSAIGAQLDSLARLQKGGLERLFDPNFLRSAQPSFAYGSSVGSFALGAAFAVEAMKANVVRCVGLAVGSFDSHNSNYLEHGVKLQETFDVLARLIEVLDATPHPTMPGEKLSERTHVLVVSEFARTPQINVNGGRDHYPTGSALVISPRFRGNTVFGRTDPEQLLPVPTRKLAGGTRAVDPPDVLATLLSAVGIDPSKHLRDGEPVAEVLAP